MSTAIDGQIPVIEIGGTHVTSAVVQLDRAAPAVLVSHRNTLAANGTIEQIVTDILRCATRVGRPAGNRWGIAVPGPFDYRAGVALFEGVGKFDALRGINLGRLLCAGLPGLPRLAFVNDAEAFLRAECEYGAAKGHERAVGVTLGTGIGSAFAHHGKMVTEGPTVPPEGRVDLLRYNNAPLEETVSRRAIMAAYRDAVDIDADVVDIAALARLGNTTAQRVLDNAFSCLGIALAPWLLRFKATVLVVGGAMAGSWDLIEPALRAGLGTTWPMVSTVAQHGSDAALIGAALHARDDPQSR